MRFVVLVCGGWVAARILIVLPVTLSLPDIIRELLPVPTRSIASERTRGDVKRVRPPQTGWTVAIRQAHPPIRPPGRSPGKSPSLFATAAAGEPDTGVFRPVQDPPGAAPPPAIRTLPNDPSASGRLSGSSWAVWRRGSGKGPLLGGSQAGLRLRYRLDANDRLALAARIATPLAGRGAEAAVGIEWRPGDLPLALVAEQRFGIDGAAGGTTLMAVAGIDAVPLAAECALSAYAQGGAVARDRIDPFVDAAVRVARPVATVGAVRVEAGAGAWGAAQRGAARLDMGPGVAALVPLGDRVIRIGMDWRQRVGGNAVPGSGIAISVGSDF